MWRNCQKQRNRLKQDIRLYEVLGQCVCRSRPGAFPSGGVYPWSRCVLRSWRILSEAQAAAYFWALWEAYPEASACWGWKAQALWGFVCLRSQLKEL